MSSEIMFPDDLFVQGALDMGARHRSPGAHFFGRPVGVLGCALLDLSPRSLGARGAVRRPRTAGKPIALNWLICNAAPRNSAVGVNLGRALCAKY